MATKRKTTRTSPTGIRFDIEKLSFISEREKLETKQQVVDFLMENYWWDKKSEDKALSAPIKHIPPSKREIVEQVLTNNSEAELVVEPKIPQNITQLKALCPKNITGLARTVWIFEKKKEYGIIEPKDLRQ